MGERSFPTKSLLYQAIDEPGSVDRGWNRKIDVQGCARHARSNSDSQASDKRERDTIFLEDGGRSADSAELVRKVGHLRRITPIAGYEHLLSYRSRCGGS